MNPDSKLLLDEMHRLFAAQKTQIDERFAESDRKLESRFDDTSRKLELRFAEVDDTITTRISEFDTDLSKRLADSDLNWERRITDSEVRQSTLISEVEKRHDDHVGAIAKVAGSLEAWRQESAGAVDDLKLKVDKLTKYWDRSLVDAMSAVTGVISPSPQVWEQTAARPSAGIMAARPSGHHVELTTREDGIGENPSQYYSPANGKQSATHVEVSQFHGTSYDIQLHNHPPDSTSKDNGRLPKLNFPIYEGETTRLWISQAEDYFDMYDVPPHRWVKVSRMHFRGSAARWIEAIHQPNRIPWPDFCKLLHNRFGRDQRDKLSRQMFHIHQTTTVIDYVKRFSSLFDQLKSYQPEPDLHYYTTRFVDGLRHDVRMIVALQRPTDLDTAYLLALLQEEMAEVDTKQEFHAVSRGPSFKPAHRPPPAPPRHYPQPANMAEKAIVKVPGPATEDKISTLRQYRRARGLCDVCAEKWFRGHKCAPNISLHAMQQVWDLLPLESFPEPPEDDQDSPAEAPEHLFVALSHDAHRGSQGRRTIQFQGSVHELPVIVLVDSGSSASFLAASVAAQLPHIQQTPLAVSVKVANGQLLHCKSVILGCPFSLGDYQFQHDLHILPLESYDLILGIDWLELYSPMEVHWRLKWLSIPYQGHNVVLQGLTALSDDAVIMQVLAVDSQDGDPEPIDLPDDIAALLAEFPTVFTVPSTLPPQRACDHAIPLISGASPVNIRAYRYPPSLKDEIERQVQTMLDQGLIQPS